MKTSRRSFLCFLSALPLARALGSKGPALWSPTPAQKEFLYSRDMRIPLRLVPGGFSESEIVALELERVQHHIPLLFERQDQFFSALETRERQGTRRRKGRGRSQRGRRG